MAFKALVLFVLSLFTAPIAAAYTQNIGNWIFTWPGSGGTANYVMTTNGSGGVGTWSQVALGSAVTGTLPIANGGTGGTTAATAFNNLSPMTTAGDLIYGGASGTRTRLAAGTGSQVLHSGATPSWAAVSLSGDVTGVLPLANGGTNKNMTPIAGGIAYTDADSLEVIAAGSSGQLLQSNGTSAPSWSTPATVTLQSAFNGGSTIDTAGGTVSISDASGGITQALQVTSDTSGASAYVTNSGTGIALRLFATGPLLRLDGSASGSHFISVPATITASDPLVLPVADGAAGTVLSNDGAGNLSWSAAGGTPSIGGPLTSATAGSVLFAGSAVFAQDNANLFYDVTKKLLGIGTAVPVNGIDVSKSAQIVSAAQGMLTGSIDTTVSTAVVGVGTLFTSELVVGDFLLVGGETHTVVAITDDTSLTVNSPFSVHSDPAPQRIPVALAVNGAADVYARITSTADTKDAALSFDDGTHEAYVGFLGSGVGGTAGALVMVNGGGTRFSVLPNGRVGVGTNAPAWKFEVKDPGTDVYPSVTADNGHDAVWRYSSGANEAYAGLLPASGGTANGWSIYNGGVRFTVLPSGNVGFGTVTPNEQLELTANLRLATSTIVKLGANRWIHASGDTTNFFAGKDAGNTSLTGTNNTGVGYQAGDTISSGVSDTIIGERADVTAGTIDNATVIGAVAMASGEGATVVGTLAIGHTGDTAFGYDAGNTGMTGGNNSLFGRNSGKALTTGDKNVMLGYDTGPKISSGVHNVILGPETAPNLTTGSYNFIVGVNVNTPTLVSGTANFILGGDTRAAGTSTGFSVFGIVGDSAIAIGDGTSAKGTDTISIGTGAGNTSNTEQQNTLVGRDAGHDNTTGAANTFIGFQAGDDVTSADQSVFIGRDADSTKADIFNGVAIGATAYVAADDTFVLGNELHNVWQLGSDQASSATAIARTLRGGNAFGTDQAAGALTIQGARSTGTGAGGDIVFKTAPAAASTASSLNTAAEVMRVNAGTAPGAGYVTITDTGGNNGNIPHACHTVTGSAGTDTISCPSNEIAMGGGVDCGNTALFESLSTFTAGDPATGYTGSCTSLLNVVTNTDIVVKVQCCAY